MIFLKMFNIKFLIHFSEIKLKITDYLKYNDLFKNGSVVLITHFISINQIYIRINTSELTEYYKKLTTEVNQFYANSKSKYKKKDIIHEIIDLCIF